MSQLTLLNLKDVPRACMRHSKKIKITDQTEAALKSANPPPKPKGDSRNNPLTVDNLGNNNNTMYSFSGV